MHMDFVIPQTQRGLSPIAFLAALILYKIILSILYVNFVSPVFKYFGFNYRYDLSLSIVSWLVYLVLLSFMKPNYSRPSDFFVFLLFILIITPMIVLMEFAGKSKTYLFYTVISFLVINVIIRLPHIRVPKVKSGKFFVNLLCFGLIFITLAMLVKSGGLGRINFDLSRVYSLREETAEIYFGGLWGYITPWTTKIAIPFFLSLSLLKRKYIVTIGIIGLQIFIFGITGHRSMALFSIIAIGMYLTRHKRAKNLSIIIMVNILLLVIYILYLYFDDIIISSTIIRRAFFLPSFINFSYYEYFVLNDKVYYSNSVLSFLSKYPYDEQLGYVVAGEIFGQPEMGANTGFLGTSYAHGGFPGMLLISSFVGLILKFFDSVCKRKSETWFYLSFSSIPVLSMLTSAAFFTSLLTHGILFLLLIIWMHNTPDNNNS